MEDNLVILNESKKNNLEFELDIEGLDTNNMRVAYVLETKDYDMSFQCSPKKGNTWAVTIPPLSHIEKTTYKYHITVIAEGYYFEPLTGVANVEGSHQIYATKPAPVSSNPVEKEVELQPTIQENKETPKTEKKVEKVEEKKETPKVEKKTTLPSDEIVQKIIEEAKKKPTTLKTTHEGLEKKVVFTKKKEQQKPIVEKKEEESKVEKTKVNEKDEKLRKLLEAEKRENREASPEKKVVFKKGSVIIH